MSYAALDATRISKAAQNALSTLHAATETSEAHARKIIMVERIAALAKAASESPNGGSVITLTSEEFWLLSKNW
ncbi:hypothetical protein AA103196_0696 [Ameyamaea chiangmaiensis NBRC 103196]|uniref:Uncharacterized protein n=1 Tax=Ameyamaea chiangmaiensis TaxID=442969 RepID=A0A850PG50_9PROT|nr:hypothetical protein [Ameyamaea chiangmaiensis]MBS4075799.1 hypothetical protein [Ameyamaea chiangmaiensis]NVN40862.1 hypothetical protein [Ameyamaea chiangmaiensis]GBQ63779.1 hypothetical protein AA103196_0696 [Ameyamaea chiangmaiensis NBRC 103196]